MHLALAWGVKANILMDEMFEIHSGEICDDIEDVLEMSIKPVESIRDLILQFGTSKLSQFIWSVVTWLKLGHIPLMLVKISVKSLL